MNEEINQQKQDINKLKAENLTLQDNVLSLQKVVQDKENEIKRLKLQKPRIPQTTKNVQKVKPNQNTFGASEYIKLNMNLHELKNENIELKKKVNELQVVVECKDPNLNPTVKRLLKDKTAAKRFIEMQHEEYKLLSEELEKAIANGFVKRQLPFTDISELNLDDVASHEIDDSYEGETVSEVSTEGYESDEESSNDSGDN